VEVVLTIVLIAGAGAWVLAVQRRLAQMRRAVTEAWKILEADQANVPVRSVYNKHVAAYNAALQAFPANIVAPWAGFKPARSYSLIPDP
jgi:hypothetical protein